MPDSIPGTFFQSEQTPPLAERPSNTPAIDISNPLQTLAPAQRRTALPEAMSPLSSEQATEGAHKEVATKSQDLMKSLRDLEDPDMYRTIPKDQPPASMGSTAVGSEKDASFTLVSEAAKQRESQERTKITISSEADAEAVARVLELLFIIVALRLLASLMGLLGRGQREKEKSA